MLNLTCVDLTVHVGLLCTTIVARWACFGLLRWHGGLELPVTSRTYFDLPVTWRTCSDLPGTRFNPTSVLVDMLLVVTHHSHDTWYLLPTEGLVTCVYSYLFRHTSDMRSSGPPSNSTVPVTPRWEVGRSLWWSHPWRPWPDQPQRAGRERPVSPAWPTTSCI